nr:hypothetical protein [Phaeobacter sp. HF9A]
MNKARIGWNGNVPDWVEALARECDLSSQAKAATRLGYSAGAVNLVLSNRYGASTDAIEQSVRGVLMAETLTCPALGEIGKDVCRKWRERSKVFSAANSQHVKMFKTCPTCVHFISAK